MKSQYYNCKFCIKDIKYNFCNIFKVYTDIIKYIKSQKYNKRIIYKIQYMYVFKKYYIKYIKTKKNIQITKIYYQNMIQTINKYLLKQISITNNKIKYYT